MTTLAEAIAQMQSAGMPDFPPGHPAVNVGRITRYGPKKVAWYILHEFTTRNGKSKIAGSYGCWGKIDSAKIEMDWRDVNADERAELQKQQRAHEEREREKRAQLAHAAANRARKQWDEAGRIGGSPSAWALALYLANKKITPESVRVENDGTLLVPLVLFDGSDGGRLIGLQKITADGTKRFNKNMAKEGAVCRLGSPPGDGELFLLCEGYSTGRSIRQACPMLTVFVCIDAGNLSPASAILRERYPASPMLFCADDDWKTEIPPGTPRNVGVLKARAAADAVGLAEIVVPIFPDAATRADTWTDFNDLAVQVSDDAVRDQVMAAVTALLIVAGAPESKKIAASADGESAPASATVLQFPPLGARPENDAQALQAAPPWHRESPGWMMHLQRTEKGAIKPTLRNAYLFFTHDEHWEGVIGWDLFAECVMKLKPPPFEGGCVGEWTELDDHRALLWLSSRMGEPGGDAVVKAVLLAAHRCEFNKLKDHLEATTWDGERRVKMWLINWCHAAKSRKFLAMPQVERDRLLAYLELVGTKWLVAAIARVYEPGCRVDNMLILESEGGYLKSTLFRILGGEWFTDARLNFQDKDSLLILQGRWIIELPELEGMNKNDASETKRFMTQHVDLFRPPYGRRLVKAPRRCILGGSVNHDTYLKDDSGNRRFWPVEVGGVIDIEGFAKIVPQLWAEALQMYRDGVKWWAEPHEKYLFEEQQEERYQQDAWESTIMDFLEGVGKFIGLCGKSNITSVAEIMEDCLKLDIARRDQMAQRRVGSILKRLGWLRKKLPAPEGSVGPARQWQYVRPEADAPQTEEIDRGA